jgi:acyl-CoA dehydrogenase
MIDFELTDRERQVRDMANQFAKFALRPMSLEADRLHRMPDDFLARVVQMRSMMPGGADADAGGLLDDEEAGEAAPAAAAAPAKEKKKKSSRLIMLGAEELAWGDASILLCLPGPGLGGPPVRFMGTKEQRRRFFGVFKQPGLHYGAYGLTEPGAGSDVSAIKTTCRKDGDHWVLNGRKCYITNGARADWVVIFATVDASKGRAGHRAFVVEKGTPGFSVGKIEEKMGLRASETAELVLEDCRVPAENLLGGEELYARKEGFMGAMKTFDASRPMVGIMAVGIARAAYDYLREFVKENYDLTRPVPRYVQIASRLGTMAREIDAARLMCWRAAWLQDEGIPNAKEASMAKAYAAKIAMGVCRDAVQLLGAHGLDKHPLVEKWYRDIKVYDIFEGTAQIQRIVIAKRILREAPIW